MSEEKKMILQKLVENKAVKKSTVKNTDKDNGSVSPIERKRRVVVPQIKEELINRIKLYKNSEILIDKNIPINIEAIMQVERVLEIDKEYPSAIHGFNPPLYIDFTKNNKIISHVTAGETVILKSKYRHKVNPNNPRTVKSLHFASLNNMTIIVAVLDNKDYYPTYMLETYEC